MLAKKLAELDAKMPDRVTSVLRSHDPSTPIAQALIGCIRHRRRGLLPGWLYTHATPADCSHLDCVICFFRVICFSQFIEINLLTKTRFKDRCYFNGRKLGMFLPELKILNDDMDVRIRQAVLGMRLEHELIVQRCADESLRYRVATEFH